ncbi:shikimate dehydrogenase/chorismate mutase/prephenate dehydratase [Anaeroplasma bactoclasticum]|jgi:monofunctional chorismate mutase|uniref:Shikimate dehydrogenase/chorismate mutase/prephenate dehydratase n=1 Tax=Anaeroplasma bactoclasticum TaxID=2088 RepID=A0A397RN88_9MOLU|nr:chorismate mutase [Anaeroplasma bactoclasticum]RIA75583.1 shikimate dehydrogenase/chorismate mutase/prephenate dehydratase [Anaeroplasma bactoclasticum]
MKNKLEEAREIINEVDNEMIYLFIKRMAAISMVAEYKMENDIPVLDSIREDTIKSRNLETLSNKQLEKYYLTFFEGVLNASKEYQKDLINKNNK